MKTPRCLLFLIAAASCVLARVSAAETAPPFTLNGWQFHDYNMPKLEEAVRRAPDYGVNFLIFSHGFFRSTEGFLASTDDVDPAHPPASLQDVVRGEYFAIHRGWQSDLRHIGAMAKERGIAYYLWVHEFDDMPRRFLKDGAVDMDDPGLFPYLEDRYNRLLQAVPDCAGFVVTLHESDYRIFRNSHVRSKDPVPERIYRVTKFFYDFLKKHNKQLIVRNFFYEPLEMEYFKSALDRLPDDVISMSKDTTHEFHPFYPWDPQHGQSGRKRQIIEIDLGVEKAWADEGVYAQTDYIHRVALRAREKRLTGLVGRARMIGDEPFNDPHEINLYAFSRYLANPDLSVNQVQLDWALRRGFSPLAAPFIASAMKRSEFINHHGRWHLENWLTKSIGAEWGDYPYYYGHVLERARSKWSGDPADRALEQKLYHPDADTYNRLVAEKDEVLAQVRAGQRDLREAATHATAAQMEPFVEGYRFLQDAASLQREWIRAYFSLRRYMDDPKEEYRVTLTDALDKLQLYERTPGVAYGLNVVTGRRYNIDAFVLEMQWRAANRSRALLEDAKILEEVRHRLDVTRN